MSYVNRRQHYIPKVFLKAFVSKHEDKRGTWVFTKGCQAADHVRLDHAASADYFYRDNLDPTNPDSLDKHLSWAEDRVESILSGLRRQDRIPDRVSNEWPVLRRFVCDLMIRNPWARHQLDPWADQIIRRAIAEYRAAGGDVSPWDDPAFIGEGGNENDYLPELIHRALGHSETISDQARAALHAVANPGPKPNIEFDLDQRHWRLLKPTRGAPFLITSDDPVVVHDEKGTALSGLKNANARITLVLSPTVALQGCHSPIGQTVVEISALEAMRINWIVANSAHREIFARESSFQWKHQAGRTYTESDWFKVASSVRD